MGGSAAERDEGLQSAGISASASVDPRPSEQPKTGLQKSPSRLNLINRSQNSAQQSSGGLGLCRTGSKMSLADLPSKAGLIPPQATPASSTQSSGKIMSPSFSLKTPKLHRSRSLNSFEGTKAPALTEGQRAVELITGKVELAINQFSPNSQTEIKNMDTLKDTAKDSFKNPNKGLRKDSEDPNGEGKDSKLVSSPRDDGDIQPEADCRVDYFSHEWNEADIAGSWRYIISRRQDMANSARLENASWRMWAKAKNKLRTIDPATVNWLKDYDVTWLYGPLYHEPDNVYSPGKQVLGATAGSSAVVTPEDLVTSARVSLPVASLCNTGRNAPISLHHGRHSQGSHLKSILKKKTLAQLMLEEINELEFSQNSTHRTPAPSKSTANYIRHHQYRPTPQGHNRQVVADILNRQYQLKARSPNPAPFEDGMIQPQTAVDDSYLPSSSNILATRDAANLGSSPAFSTKSSLVNLQTSSRAGSQISFRRDTGSLVSLRSNFYFLTDRRVHFNDRVEQCIALDPEDEAPRDSRCPNLASFQIGKSAVESGDHNRLLDEGDDEDDDEDEDDDDDSCGLFLGLRRPSMLDVRHENEKPHIIAALPATTLKFQSDTEDSDRNGAAEDIGQMSSRRPGLNAQYAPHPVQKFEIVDPAIRPVRFEAKGIAQNK